MKTQLTSSVFTALGCRDYVTLSSSHLPKSLLTPRLTPPSPKTSHDTPLSHPVPPHPSPRSTPSRLRLLGGGEQVSTAPDPTVRSKQSQSHFCFQKTIPPIATTHRLRMTQHNIASSMQSMVVRSIGTPRILSIAMQYN